MSQQLRRSQSAVHLDPQHHHHHHHHHHNPFHGKKVIISQADKAVKTLKQEKKEPLSQQHLINWENLSPCYKKLDFVGFNEICERIGEIEDELREAPRGKKSFSEVIKGHYGDCQAAGQKPITFLRQVMAICTLPDVLMDDERLPADAKQRAQNLLEACSGHTIGSYTSCVGLDAVRKDVAKHLTRRDHGVPHQYEDVILCSASAGIKALIEFLMQKSSTGHETLPTGFMTPIPEYNLYSNTLTEYGAYQIPYYLDEERGWQFTVEELERAYKASLAHCVPRCIVVINPNNPTGNVLTEDAMEQIVRWAQSKGLFILADEVYQDNVYDDRGAEFHSFREVAYRLGRPYSKMEMASVFSLSKSYVGECGLRGGYIEVMNMDARVKLKLEDLFTANSPPTTLAQVCLSALLNPPRPGEPSHEQYVHEKSSVMACFEENARILSSFFNSLDGMKCAPIQGSMFCFPRVFFPKKFLEKAKRMHVEPDVLYCLELLDKKGVAFFPGTAFKQRPGTWHIRASILPPREQIEVMMDKVTCFHKEFMQKWKEG